MIPKWQIDEWRSGLPYDRLRFVREEYARELLDAYDELAALRKVAEAPLQCAKCMAMACVFLRDGQDRPVRYEWRDGQLWDRARQCWVVWETISGKIGMANGMDRLVVRLLNDEPDRDMHLNGNERKLLEGQPFCPRCQNVTTPDVNGREFCPFCMAPAGA